MLFIYNLSGAAFLLSGLAAGFLAQTVFRAIVSDPTHETTVATVTAALVCLAVDFGYRLQSVAKARFINPLAGGHIWFVPIWCVGSCVLLGYAMHAIIGNTL